jgi:hypothetical protein
MARPKGEDTRVIESIFNERWDPKRKTLSEPLVTLNDLQQAYIKVTGGAHGNPARIWKDLRRKTTSANERWPRSVFDLGYAAKGVTGGGASFQFIKTRPGQTEPFASLAGIDPYVPGVTITHAIESVSMPTASKRLGRSDEAWLIQTLVRLRILETHFALHRQSNIVHIDHLQSSLKLRKREIDALFLAEQNDDGKKRELAISLEAKGAADDILEDQLVGQVEVVLKELTDTGVIPDPMVIPMAAKTVAPSVILIIEFDPMVTGLEGLSIRGYGYYHLVPPVPGIGERSKKSKSKARPPKKAKAKR